MPVMSKQDNKKEKKFSIFVQTVQLMRNTFSIMGHRSIWESMTFLIFGIPVKQKGDMRPYRCAYPPDSAEEILRFLA